MIDTKTVTKSIADVKESLFSQLKILNVLMTNKCNLQCKYCYEQHTKDYGRFTVESLKKVYDFLHDPASPHTRFMQFFGGEPLLQKDLILDFCRTYADELSENKDKTRVAIVTNGVLLTPEFVNEFCAYGFTSLMVSLDTDRAEVDGRNLDQTKIDHIFEMIKLAVPYSENKDHAIAIRCTMSQKNAPYLKPFIDHLYAVGIRCTVIHPLIMSNETGFIEWEPELWNKMEDDLLNSIREYGDFDINWAEGLGSKSGSSCLTGDEMIAIDAAGDFSGCHFFTNLKEPVESLLLGNILKDEIYVSRYASFQKQFMELMQHPECVACDLKGICYQCPAGNLSTDGVLFRPDSMCKKIVSLAIKIREDRNKRQLLKKFEDMVSAYNAEGEIVFSRTVLHFIHFMVLGRKLEEDLANSFNELPPIGYMLSTFVGYLENIKTGRVDVSMYRAALSDVRKYVHMLNSLFAGKSPVNFLEAPTSAAKAYGYLCHARGMKFIVRELGLPGGQETAYFLSLMHLLVLGS